MQVRDFKSKVHLIFHVNKKKDYNKAYTTKKANWISFMIIVSVNEFSIQGVTSCVCKHWVALECTSPHFKITEVKSYQPATNE